MEMLINIIIYTLQIFIMWFGNSLSLYVYISPSGQILIVHKNQSYFKGKLLE